MERDNCPCNSCIHFELKLEKKGARNLKLLLPSKNILMYLESPFKNANIITKTLSFITHSSLFVQYISDDRNVKNGLDV